MFWPHRVKPFVYSATEFLHKLQTLHLNSSQTSTRAQETADPDTVNMSDLRQTMDLCLEKLPTLLKIDMSCPASVTQLLPRVLSQLRALSVYSDASSVGTSEERLSESMGYVLQKVESIFM